MIFRVSQNYKKSYMEKIKSTPPYLTCDNIDLNCHYFSCFLCSNLWRWRLLIEQIYQLPKNMLEDSPTPSRCTKIRVLNTGDTPSLVFLESTKKKIFLNVSLLYILAVFFAINIKLQRLKVMPQTFQKTAKIRYKHAEKI